MKRIYRLILYFILDAAVFACAFVFYPKNGADRAVYLIAYCLSLVIANTLFFQIEYAVFLKRIKRLSEAMDKAANGDYKTRLSGDAVDKNMREMAANFNALIAAAEAQEATTENFISDISHELRSPLSSIQNSLTAVLDGTVDAPERGKYLQIALSETKHLSELVSSMLDLSRLDAGNFRLQPTEFDINALITEILLRLERRIAAKNIALRIDFCAENQCTVYADRTLIGQVVVNLVDNAIKYSPEYSPLIVSTARAGGLLAISICDSGCGIDPEEQRLIFEKFYRSDRARTPGKGMGTGIGLALVKKIIAVHSQTITISSEKGVGSTFTFTLEAR